MQKVKTSTLSNVSTKVERSERLTRQTLHSLSFIHRFRHVTSFHLKISLGHINLSSTSHLLARLQAKGYIARTHLSDNPGNPAMSYYLTPEGLVLLRAHDPELPSRSLRSVRTDATLGNKARMRCLTLADTYVHFKRHYDGHLKFFAARDLKGLEVMPQRLPDGYVRLEVPNAPVLHCFIEIYGWGKSNNEQWQRLLSYVRFIEDVDLGFLESPTGTEALRWYIVAGGYGSQQRLIAQVRYMLRNSLVVEPEIYTTTMSRLMTDKPDIWRKVHE